MAFKPDLGVTLEQIEWFLKVSGLKILVNPRTVGVHQGNERDQIISAPMVYVSEKNTFIPHITLRVSGFTQR